MTLQERVGEWYNTPLRYEFDKPYMKKLHAYVRSERMKHTVYPPTNQVFRALRETPLQNVKVVILGQDPYPHPAANGLAFSCSESLERIPPSLSNIFTEIEHDIGFQPYHNPDLGRWARQGVLLLNTSLTVRAHQPGSHAVYQWKQFTGKVLELVCNKSTPVVFMLWGREAHYFGHKIPDYHHIIFASHPSPWSAHTGFFGSQCFSRCNTHLRKDNQEPIDWLNNEI